MKKTSHRTLGGVTHRTLASEKTPSNIFEEILDVFTLKMKPVSLTFIQELAKESVQSALLKKNDITAMGFFLRKGYGAGDIKRWSERSETFKQLYEKRKSIIALKRETGASLKDFDDDKEYIRLNENFVRLSMPLYDPEYAQLEKDRAALSKEQQAEPVKYVVIEKFEEEK